MGTDRLTLYNNALLICGERFLAALDEEVKARRLLDQAWQGGSAIDYCLEQGQWQFAMRTDQIGYDPDIQNQFGFTYAFDKPTDWILTSALCSDERFQNPLLQYTDETDYWFADITPIYVKYVSNDGSYGGDLGRWPTTFQDYVAAYLASQIILSLTSDQKKQDRILAPEKGLLDMSLMRARSRAAMALPTKFAAAGTWVRARLGRRNGGGFDRGNPGSLLG